MSHIAVISFDPLLIVIGLPFCKLFMYLCLILTVCPVRIRCSRVSLIVFEIIVCLGGNVKRHMADVLSLISVIDAIWTRTTFNNISTIFAFIKKKKKFLIEYWLVPMFGRLVVAGRSIVVLTAWYSCYNNIQFNCYELYNVHHYIDAHDE